MEENNNVETVVNSDNNINTESVQTPEVSEQKVVPGLTLTPPTPEPTAEVKSEAPVTSESTVSETTVVETPITSEPALTQPVSPVAQPTSPVETETQVAPAAPVEPTPTAVPVQNTEVKNDNDEIVIKKVSKKAQIIGTIVILVLVALIVYWIIRRFFLL